MSGLRRVRDRLRNRRGATLVMIGIMMAVMVGMVGAGVDFARMYAFKAQLQLIADAGAMAGAVELLHSRNNTNVPDSARKFTQQNHVNGNDTAFVATDTSGVAPGAWNFATRTFTVSSWGATNVNSVRVRALYTAPYTFGRIFGANTSALSGVAVAALGSVGSSNCMKPWAVPYENILWTLGKTAPYDLNYALTPSDVATLRDNQTIITFKTSPNDPSTGGPGQAVTGSGVLIPGNYYAVQFPQAHAADGTAYPNGKPDPGAAAYQNWISGPCMPYTINVGDWLQTETGNMNGPTGQGTSDLCDPGKGKGGGGGGGAGGGGSTEKFTTCKANNLITMPIYGQAEDKGGGTLEVQVKYIGAFYLTAYGNKGSVRGYLTAISSGGGGFVNAPGPVSKAALTL